MNSGISPEIELLYEQLLWIERRRFRLMESVSSHFGKPAVERALLAGGPLASPLAGEPEFVQLLDEREPMEFLRALAFEAERIEAVTVTRLRAHVSVYRQHVDEQLLFGARTAGQEAARSFLSRAPAGQPRPGPLSVPEAVQAVYDLTYAGMPEEKNYFLLLRSQGGSTVHVARSPHLAAWKSAGADPRFLHDLRREWVRGILDILAPDVAHTCSQAIEQGAAFGLEHFHHREHHAGP